MSEEKIISYKGFDKDMKCRGFQFEVGKEYEEAGVKVCEKGFHACENPLDVLNYCNDVDGKYCIVEQSGEIDRERGNGKIASSKIRIKAEIGFVGLFKSGVEWIKTITNPKAVIEETRGKGDNPSGDSAKIGSSGDSAKIKSTGEDAVVCCAGRNSIAKAKAGSWILYPSGCIRKRRIDISLSV